MDKSFHNSSHQDTVRSHIDLSNINIFKIKSESDLILTGRLRYQATVEEMGLDMKHADHGMRTVIEPLDHFGHIFVAWNENGEAIGTVRINIIAEGDIGHYYDLYDVERIYSEKSATRVSVTTRMVVDKRYRGTRLSLMLSQAAYGFYLENNIEYDVIDCRHRLVPFFQKLGFVEHVKSLTHPEFGSVKVSYLDVNNEKHLECVKSPFLNQLRKHQEQSC